MDDKNELIVNLPLNIDLNIPDLLEKAKKSSYDEQLYIKITDWKAKFGNGSLIIGFSTQQLTNLRQESFHNLSVSLTVILISSILLFSAIAISITKPLNKLINVLSEISTGDLTKRADNTEGSIELKTLADSFNLMLDKIIESQNLRINEFKSFNLTLESKNFKLTELNNDKNEFFGIVAHDLKNPLASIMLNAEMISNYFDRIQKKDVLDYITKILITAKSMNLLIRDLLDINALESGNINLEIEQVDISALINNIISNYYQRAANKGIIINEKIDTSLFVKLDSMRLSQIIDNLISNAIKFSPLGKSIYVNCTLVDNNARIEIIDEGPGISPDDIGKLFTKFSRLSAKPTANESSTGLGLSIAKRLTEAMGGKIWYESEKDKGAKFIIEIPKNLI